MWEFAGMTNLEVWYSSLPVQDGLPNIRAAVDRRTWKAAEQAVEKAKTRDHLQAFAKLTHEVDGERRIISDPPLVVPIEEFMAEADAQAITEAIHELLGRYRRTLLSDRRRLLEDFRFAHIARKVAGVGSVGTRAWIVLFTGRDGSDPLFPQAKEAQASVLEPYVGRSSYTNAGRRVVEGQRLMQASSDIFLGWERTPELDGVTRDFYIRQLHDWKGSLPTEGMTRPRCPSTVASAAGRSRERMRARATGSRSPPTWARATRSTERSPRSPSGTRIRTSATTPRCRGPSRRSASWRRPACEPMSELHIVSLVLNDSAQ
jgi:hypothetical protein